MTSTAKKAPFERNTEYTNWTPPDTADITALREYGDTAETLQPALEGQYNRARENNSRRYRSQYNQGGTTAAARIAQEGEAERGLTADYGAALGQSAYDAKQQGLARRTFLAGLTVPRPLATRESGYNTQPNQGGGLSGVLGGVGSVLGGLAMFSDERLKDNIKPTRPVLDKLDGYQAKEWDWKDGSGHEDGVVAQDLDDSFPEAVVEEAGEPLKVNYGDPSLAAQALQGVKELDMKINRLMRQRQMGYNQKNG